MSRNKRANEADNIYRNHLQGGAFANNPGNNRTAILERMYLRVLTELAVNRYKWSGLPDSIDVRWLEMCLFYQGLAVFFYDDTLGKFLALKGGSTSFLNMMNNPTAFQVVGTNYGGKLLAAASNIIPRDTLPVAERGAIPIWANYMRIPDIDIVTIYATKLAEIDRTIEINSKNARRSKVLVSNENQRLSVENINREIDEGQAAVRIAPNLADMTFVQAFDLGVDPRGIEPLHILRTRLWSECMGLLGIDNANQDKKERLVAAEVDANNDQTSMQRFVNLNERRKAAKWITELYGDQLEGEVTVDFYTEVDPTDIDGSDIDERQIEREFTPETTIGDARSVSNGGYRDGA